MALPRTLSVTLDKIARQAVGKDWNLYAALLDHWTEIVGEEYAQSTSPVKIAFPKGKKTPEKWASNRKSEGTLHIRLPQGLSMAFGFLSETIKTRINGFFGYEAISRIVLEPYYPTERPSQPLSEPLLSDSDKERLSQKTKDIENKELRDSLQQLGESVIRKAPRD